MSENKRMAMRMMTAVLCAGLLYGCGTGKAAATVTAAPAAVQNMSYVVKTSAAAKTADSTESTADGEATVNSGRTPKYHTMQTAPINRGEINGCGGIQGTITEGSDSSETITIDCSDTTGKSYTVKTAAIGDIILKEAIAPGLKVSLTFAGSLLNAGDDITKVTPVALLDAQEHWDIDVRSGVTTANAMSSFSMQEDNNGPAFTFLKDNCPIEDGVLSNDSGEHVEVTFVTTTDGDRYPIKIRAAK